LLRAKDDLLSEEGQSLNSIFAVCFSDCFIGIPFVGDNVVAKCINNVQLGAQKGANLGLKCVRMRLAAGLCPEPRTRWGRLIERPPKP